MLKLSWKRGSRARKGSALPARGQARAVEMRRTRKIGEGAERKAVYHSKWGKETHRGCKRWGRTNCLLNWSPRVPGGTWINREGRRRWGLGTSVGNSKRAEVVRGGRGPRRDQCEDGFCLTELKTEAGWEGLSLSPFLSAHF